MGFMQNQSLDISKIVTETSTEPSPILLEEDNDMEVPQGKVEERNAEKEKKFITSPADTDSSDIGKTSLIKMETDTGDSPAITPKPYTLPLKHAEWVQKELEILEKAGVIVKSVSPWASPIVIIPKRTALGEPPKRRLCVDYQAINSLLPPVKKAFSKAKGILTLVPLPKIDEIYARLKGF